MTRAAWTLALALVASPALPAPPGLAGEVAEHVITFDAVTVRVPPRLIGPVEHPPAEAGREDHADVPAVESGGALAFAPGPARANPSFVEGGFVVEAFWAVKTGTPAGHFVPAHFHPPTLATGFEGQHWGYRDELHGIHIRAQDGRPFWLKSLRYRVTRNRELKHRPFSIEGFSNFSVNVLVATRFDPWLAVRTQFAAFPLGPPLGNDLSLPFLTLPITGFEHVTEVFIASSASVDLDDIVLVAAPSPGPETAPGGEDAAGEPPGARR
jgi:hypothetical protein